MSDFFSGWQRKLNPRAGGPKHRTQFSFGMAVVLSSLVAVPAMSADVLGELNFEIGGETTRWQIISREARGRIRNSATLTKGDLFDQFETTAYAVAPDSRERFTISVVFGRPFGASSAVNYDMPTDVSMVRLLDGITGPLWEARDINIAYSLEFLTQEEGNATGEFSATFCYQESLYDDPDESSCALGAGTFETRFAIENDE